MCAQETVTKPHKNHSLFFTIPQFFFPIHSADPNKTTMTTHEKVKKQQQKFGAASEKSVLHILLLYDTRIAFFIHASLFENVRSRYMPLSSVGLVLFTVDVVCAAKYTPNPPNISACAHESICVRVCVCVCERAAWALQHQFHYNDPSQCNSLK